MLGRRKILKSLSVLAIILNTVSFIYGLFYILVPESAFAVNFFGALFLLALTVNLFLVYFNNIWGAVGKLNLWGTVYLLVTTGAVLLMWGGGVAASAVYERSTILLIFYTTLYPGYLIPLLIGTFHARLTLLAMSGRISDTKRDAAYNEPGSFSRKKIIVLIILFLLLLPGFFFAYILMSDLYLGLLQILVSQYALYWAFFYLSIALLILHIYPKDPVPLRYFTGLTGLALFVIFLVPLFLMPGAVVKAEEDFAAVCGENWREQIHPSYEEYFTPRTFSIPAYFLGVPPGEYRYKRDVLYYEGTEGVDEGIRLYYDVFMPPENSENLPGYGSTIIRIHGGGWISGSKGAGNMMPVNSHFASMGYTVFDIQYGLTDVINLFTLNRLYDFIGFLNRFESLEESSSLSVLGAPEHVKASFTLDDMVRHLGIFSRYLTENAAGYGADPRSVFISGASAGGHLSTAMALAVSSGEYHDLFCPEMRIRGFIPFYPGNKIDRVFEEIGGAEEWKDVETLIRDDSPPCLIYQGENDGMVPPETSLSFREKYLEAGNESCAVIHLPRAAHASDFHFSGYYNQLFLYYMDRFLALYK